MSDDRRGDDEAQTLRFIAESILRVEELLRFLPLPDATVKDLRQKIALLRTILLEQRPPAFVLVGRRGAGKSSLINAIFGSKMAEVGHVRARTGRPTWFQHRAEQGAIEILDTRGMQEGSVPEEGSDARDAMASIVAELKKKAPDVLVFLVKATEVDSAIDADLEAIERVYAELEREHKFRPPLMAIATHCDVLEPKGTRLHRPGDEPTEDIEEKLARVAEVEHHLEGKIRERPKLRGHLVFTRGISTYMSFKDGGVVRSDERFRVEELLRALYKHIPQEGRGTFARVAQLRGLQEELAGDLSRATATLCAGIAALPLPVADLLPITALQVSLIATIAWLAGRPLDRRAATEFLGAMGVNVGVAFAFREGARALIKFVFPGAGNMVSGAVAFGGTLAIGAAARAYFLRGASVEEAKEIYEDTRTTAPEPRPPSSSATDVTSPDPRADEVKTPPALPPGPTNAKKRRDWNVN